MKEETEKETMRRISDGMKYTAFIYIRTLVTNYKVKNITCTAVFIIDNKKIQKIQFCISGINNILKNIKIENVF